jgi:monofunctional biosynthetic peptidoglycan transglycosylase
MASVPSVNDLATVNPTETSYLRHAGSRALVAARPWTPLAGIAPTLVSAVIRAEDPRFFQHHGLDWKAMRSLVYGAIHTGRVSGGGSTIPQQLARNLYLTPARSIVRKLREMRLAHRIDRMLPKTRILELYLNLVEWGPGVWGCAAASDYYFHKAPRDLDVFESTFLVTLLPAPKAGLTGRFADRSRQAQLSIAHELLLSGLVSGAACALCCARVRELHRLIADGVPLLAALAHSADVTAEDDAELIDAIVADLHLEPVPPDQMLTWRCADKRQQQIAVAQLSARFGPEVLSQALATGRYAVLLNHPSAPHRHAES